MSWLKTTVEIINYLFFGYMMVYAVFLFLSALVGALELEKRARNRTFRSSSHAKQENMPPVSILVPAYNEEITLLDTVQSLSKLDYGEYEIIVIDDGSTDQTAQLLIETYQLIKVDRPIRRQVASSYGEKVYESINRKAKIVLICKANGGKADALNVGINVSRYPYFMTIDGDTILQKDTLRNLIRPFMEDDRVIACGGMVQIANEATIHDGQLMNVRSPKNLLAMMQSIEYGRSFLGSRILFNAFYGNLIISGACGLFNKSMVIAVGGYNTQCIGEDMELVMNLHAFCRSHGKNYKIAYEPEAICWSQAPESIKGIHSQRTRWHTGLLQSLYAYRNILFNYRYGMIGWLSTLYYLFMEALSPLIEMLGFLNIILATYLSLLDVQFMVRYFFLFVGFSALVSVTTYFTRIYALPVRLTLGQIIKILVFSLAECLGFRQLITLFRIEAIINFRPNRQKSWGKIERQAHNRAA